MLKMKMRTKKFERRNLIFEFFTSKLGYITIFMKIWEEKIGPFFKGNPNYQDIISWIIQIVHYYCRKQYKNIENSQIIEQNLVLSLPFSLFTAACASCCLPRWQNFKRHKWSFVPYILFFSGWKWFSPS